MSSQSSIGRHAISNCISNHGKRERGTQKINGVKDVRTDFREVNPCTFLCNEKSELYRYWRTVCLTGKAQGGEHWTDEEGKDADIVACGTHLCFPSTMLGTNLVTQMLNDPVTLLLEVPV